MPCVSKPTCAHVIIISLWLICYIQCGVSISYLFISWYSHVFTFSFQIYCSVVSLIYLSVFWEDSKKYSVVGGRGNIVFWSFVSRLVYLISFHVYGLLLSLSFHNNWNLLWLSLILSLSLFPLLLIIVFLYTQLLWLSNNLLFIYMLFTRGTITFTLLILVSLIMNPYSKSRPEG